MIKNHQLIFLTGLPGAGKTYWGKKWAAHYGWQFADLDEMIVQQTGQTIPTIFSSLGEAWFRRQEQETLLNIISEASKNTIIATGGGTILSEQCRNAMAAHTVIWLQSPLEELARRLQSATSIRPLLASGNILDTLQRLLSERAPWYSQAHVLLDSRQLSLETFQTLIDSCLKPH